MKKRSEKRRFAPNGEQLHEPVYFVDRSLGKKFCRLLVDAGVVLVPYHERYPRDEKVADEVWLRDACQAGEISLSHDKTMRLTDEIMDHYFRADYDPSAALFVLRGDQTGEEHAAMFLAARARVERMARSYRKRRLPFVAHIHRATAKGGRQVVEVEKRLERTAWIARAH